MLFFTTESKIPNFETAKRITGKQWIESQSPLERSSTTYQQLLYILLSLWNRVSKSFKFYTFYNLTDCISESNLLANLVEVTSDTKNEHVWSPSWMHNHNQDHSFEKFCTPFFLFWNSVVDCYIIWRRKKQFHQRRHGYDSEWRCSW